MSRRLESDDRDVYVAGIGPVNFEKYLRFREVVRDGGKMIAWLKWLKELVLFIFCGPRTHRKDKP